MVLEYPGDHNFTVSLFFGGLHILQMPKRHFSVLHL